MPTAMEQIRIEIDLLRRGIACVRNEGGFILQQVALRQTVICSQAAGDLRKPVTPTDGERYSDND